VIPSHSVSKNQYIIFVPNLLLEFCQVHLLLFVEVVVLVGTDVEVVEHSPYEQAIITMGYGNEIKTKYSGTTTLQSQPPYLGWRVGILHAGAYHVARSHWRRLTGLA
jgi:hypothetical protein